MLETVFTKHKNLEELQHFLSHYQQIYPQAKQEGKVVLRYYINKVNYRIQHLLCRSKSK